MIESKAKRYLKTLARCLAVALAANVIFLLVRLADSVIPRVEVAGQIRRAFEDGTLPEKSYPQSLMQGADQYTDCVSMQIAVLGNTTLWTNALAPRIVSPENWVPGMPVATPDRSLELKELVNGPAQLPNADTYTRFWHGQSTILGVALMFLSLDGYRALLLLLTLALIAACAITAALQGPRLLLSLAPLFLVSFLLSGQIRYGQLVSFGPAQIACWALVLLGIALHRRLTLEHWLMLAVLAGALEAFVDMMISISLTAGIFLTVAGTLLAMRSTSVRATAASMLALTVAWSSGFVATYVSKLALTSAALGWRAVLLPFVTQLKFRVGVVDPQTRMPEVSWFEMISFNIEFLSQNFWQMGYTRSHPQWSSSLIWWLAFAGWVYALWRFGRACLHKRALASLTAGAGYLAASAFVLAWVAIFPEHTWRHSWIAVRATTIWIAGGWGWALTDLVLRRAARPSAPGAGEPSPMSARREGDGLRA